MQIIRTQTIDHSIMPAGLTMLIFGQPKTHKSTELAKWSDRGSAGTLVIDTQFGTDFIGGINKIHCVSLYPPMIPVLDLNGNQMTDERGLLAVEPLLPENRGYIHRNGAEKGQAMAVYSLDEILTYIYTELANGTFEFDTVVLDTFDQIVRWEEVETCITLGINSIGEAEFGKDYALTATKVNNIFFELKRVLMKAGKSLVLVSHSKQKLKVEANSSDKTKVSAHLASTLPTKIEKVVLGEADIIGYVEIESKFGKRKAKMSFDNCEELHMGSRLRNLAGKTINFDYETFKNTIEGKPSTNNNNKQSKEITNGKS